MVGDQGSGPPSGTFSCPSMLVLRESLFSAQATSRPRGQTRRLFCRRSGSGAPAAELVCTR